MYKPPKFMEMNASPERLNTSAPSGAVSQLANQLKDPPQFDGVTLEQMQGNPLYRQNVDKIDKVGLAQQEITKAAKAVSKSKFVRQLNKQMQHDNIPKQNK